MFNVAIKKTKSVIILSTALTIASCGGSSVSENAQRIYNEALRLNSQCRYQDALDLLDSIDAAYPEATDVRRQAVSLRPIVLEQLTNRQLEIADSISAVSAFRLDSMSASLRLVSNPIENYYIPQCEGRVDVGGSVGLHARMAPDGRPYIIATAPGHLRLTAVSVSAGGESASTPAVAHDGERSDRSGINDVVTFIEGECIEIGNFISEHKNEPLSVSFSGDKTVSVQLSEPQKQGVASVFEISSLIRQRKKQEIEKQRLERMLQAVRSQIARTVRDTIPSE